MNSAPATQKAPKISHAPSVLRTSRIVATAAPDSTDDTMPMSGHKPNAAPPAGARPTITSATPVVVTTSAKNVPGPICSPRNSHAHSAVNTGAV